MHLNHESKCHRLSRAALQIFFTVKRSKIIKIHLDVGEGAEHVERNNIPDWI